MIPLFLHFLHKIILMTNFVIVEYVLCIEFSKIVI